MSSAPEIAPQRSRPPSLPGIWELAWPTITGNLLVSLVGLVNLKIVGALGASAIAAVGAGNRVFFVSQAILTGVTTGTTALVSRAWGAADRDEAGHLTRTSVLLCVAAAAVLSLPGLLAGDRIAALFRVDPEAVAQAGHYIRLMCAFNVFFAAGLALSAALRAVGDVSTPLWVASGQTLLNGVLDYGFVYGRFGMPELGVPGAALASGLSFAVGALVLVALWTSRRLVLGTGTPGSVRWARARAVLAIGYPAAIEQAIWQGGFVGFLFIVGLYGTAPFAAYNIGVQILSFSFLIGFGFSIASSARMGQCLGARDVEAARQGGWQALRLSVAAMTVFGAAIIVFARPLARFLIDDPEVIELTVLFIYILGAVQPLMAIEFALAGALRGAGDTRIPLATTFIGLIAVRVSGAALLAWLGAEIGWIYGVLILDYIAKATLLTLRFRSGRWANAIPDPAR